ncbi:MAG: DUF1415 domain-containing protein [Thiogranum sp.]|nr:DUF1415 domain-containing protein [Thiogranum sp.]
MVISDTDVIAQTRRWIETVIIGSNFCPFAAREMQRDSIHYRVVRDSAPESGLLAIAAECQRLDRDEEIETTLVLLPDACADFDDYLDFVAIAEQLLLEQGYEGVYQLASFHPEYLFEDTDAQDPANYTNRAPYPMLHLLRESSIERALLNYPQAEQIPLDNIVKARRLGLESMKALLAACREETK